MSFILVTKPFQKLCVGSKDILEFRFGPNLGLRLEAGAKLNNNSAIPLAISVNMRGGRIHAVIQRLNYTTI